MHPMNQVSMGDILMSSLKFMRLCTKENAWGSPSMTFESSTGYV
jgi:hypothetical protein